jgi:hypothetical protein
VLSKKAFYTGDPARMVLEEMESYCAAHPNSPSAVRRPGLSNRSGLWIALLGPSIEEGIVGLGFTVEAALRAFDIQYMAGLRSAERFFFTRTDFGNAFEDRRCGRDVSRITRRARQTGDTKQS